MIAACGIVISSSLSSFSSLLFLSYLSSVDQSLRYLYCFQ